MKNIILISGKPGAGKSTLGKALAKKLKCTVLDKDCVDEAFSPGERGKEYQTEIQPKSVTALFNLTELNLEMADNIILDAPWGRIFYQQPHLLDNLNAISKKLNSKIFGIECELAEDKLKKRITSRNLKRDHFRIKDENTWNTFYKNNSHEITKDFLSLTINMTSDTEDNIDIIYRHLS